MELDLLWIAVFFALFYFYLEKKLGDIKDDLMNQYFIMESVLGKQARIQEQPRIIQQEQSRIIQQEQSQSERQVAPPYNEQDYTKRLPPTYTQQPESIVPTPEELIDYQPKVSKKQEQQPVFDLQGYDGKTIYASFTA